MLNFNIEEIIKSFIYTHIAVTCDYPPTRGDVVVVMGSDSPLIEGQFITYTCPPGFILTGPNASVCTGNGEWEPDPGEVDCIGDYDHNGTTYMHPLCPLMEIPAC